MSQVEVLPVQSRIDLSFNSSILGDTFPILWHPETRPIDVPDADEEPDASFPNLPPVQYGHPNFHLRNGVMRALTLAADGEPDAEHAFFVADLSQVYLQWQRWKRCLPEIEPFFGTYPSPFESLRSSLTSLFRSYQIQPRPLRPTFARLSRHGF